MTNEQIVIVILCIIVASLFVLIILKNGRNKSRSKNQTIREDVIKFAEQVITEGNVILDVVSRLRENGALTSLQDEGLDEISLRKKEITDKIITSAKEKIDASYMLAAIKAMLPVMRWKDDFNKKGVAISKEIFDADQAAVEFYSILKKYESRLKDLLETEFKSCAPSNTSRSIIKNVNSDDIYKYTGDFEILKKMFSGELENVCATSLLFGKGFLFYSLAETVTPELVKEVIASMSHGALGNVLAEMVSQEVTTYVTVELGQEGLHQFLELVGSVEMITATILMGWRIYRYTKLYRKLTNDVLPSIVDDVIAKYMENLDQVYANPFQRLSEIHQIVDGIEAEVKESINAAESRLSWAKNASAMAFT